MLVDICLVDYLIDIRKSRALHWKTSMSPECTARTMQTMQANNQNKSTTQFEKYIREVVNQQISK